ncbi:MBL fold metallo-hydrolase [Paenibacillus sonchi]|uniref:MBL fold metallo-hydrolase n=1 Tax=Paenibacillus sonchi TaxID=373687 RepID=A0A974PBH5_9BACL|nr:MBL fold metallo-hydrolase [Paenibacillus sonchi]QQZ60262.1 MBL fold metallo-hydrolase [Paenibacillus sonchi]
MKIIELPVEFEYNGQPNYIYPSLIVSENELTLVDTGYPGFLPFIEKEIVAHGYDIMNLKNILITHYDDDHIGSLYDFKAKYPSVTIMASGVEAECISGKVKPERLVQAEAMLEHMPEEQQGFGHWFVQRLKSLQHVSVDQTVHDGEWILNQQCKVIATPGHTSGHISLYFPELSSVITGDAAVRDGDELIIANPDFCLDRERADQSLNVLQNLQAKSYYCYHGGSLTL